MINIIDEIKYAIQRIKRGYSDRDLWDFDVYLANLIISGLKQFKQENNSKEPTKKEIDLVIKGFKSNLKLIEGNISPKSKEGLTLYDEFYRGTEIFRQIFNSLWD